MQKTLMLVLILIGSINSYAQQYGTTDNGKRIILYQNGTWSYLESDTASTTNYIYLGGVKYQSGQTENITDDISVTIINKPSQTMILFWEDCDEEINLFNWVWEGKVTLYLENGETIILSDRKINGINNEDGKYQRYSLRWSSSAGQYFCQM